MSFSFLTPIAGLVTLAAIVPLVAFVRSEHEQGWQSMRRQALCSHVDFERHLRWQLDQSADAVLRRAFLASPLWSV